MNWTKSVAWWAMLLMALAIGIYALMFFSASGMGDPSFKAHYDAIPISARLHIIPGGLALILGALQFNSGLRQRRLNWHRYAGRAYVIFVLIGAIAGLVLAWHTPRDPATRIGFGLLAVVWFYSGCMAYLAVRAGNIKLHQQWMIRSYALTLAAVTLRIQLGIYQEALDMSFEASYSIVSWLCWVPNLIIAEWFFIQAPVNQQPHQGR